MRWLTTGLRWLNIVVATATLIAYLAPYIHPSILVLPAFFGLFWPLWLGLNVAFILFWVLLRKRYFLLSLICLGVGFPYILMTFSWHIPTSTDVSTKEVIRVMSYNTKHLQHYDYGDDDTRLEAAHNMLDLASDATLDFFCVQEMGGNHLTKQHINYLRNLGFLHRYGTSGGLTIFSKYPIVDKGILKFENTRNAAVYADVKLSEQLTVRLYNLHLQSIYFSRDDYAALEQLDLELENRWTAWRSIAHKIKRANIRRAIQTDRIAEHIAQSPYPIILCGDFNDPPVSYTYLRLTEHLQDSFRQRGFGFGTTYAGQLPFLRIDYILADHQFQVLSHKVIRKGQSDHYPIVSELKME